MPQQSMRSFEQWESSVRNFEWVQGAIPGATDLDMLVERNGNFLILESKTMEGSGVNVPFGQYLALNALAKVPKFQVMLVGEGPKGGWFRYWLSPDSGIRNGTRPVWFPKDWFTRIGKDDLREELRAWWNQMASR